MNLMPWLAQRGFVSRYADIFDLPVQVLEDVTLVAVAEENAWRSDDFKARSQ